MHDPVSWTILSLCTVISLIFSVYSCIVGKQIKELSISCTTNKLINLNDRNIEKLTIEYNGEVIKELSVSLFYIWNSGNQTLTYSDIASSRPISIINTGIAHIFDAQIIKQSEPANAFVITKCTHGATVFDFEYMGKGDGIAVQILHSGPSVDLELSCKIKGVKEIRDCSPIIRKRKEPKISFVADVLLAIFTAILSIWIGMIGGIVLYSIIPPISPIIRSILTSILSCLFVGLTVLCISRAIDKIKEKCRRTIPVILKYDK